MKPNFLMVSALILATLALVVSIRGVSRASFGTEVSRQMSSQELAQGFEEFLLSRDELTVETDLSIAVFAGRSLGEGEDLIHKGKEAFEIWERISSDGELRVESEGMMILGGVANSSSNMTPNSFDYKVWYPAMTADSPVIAYRLSPEPEPTITEEHWREGLQEMEVSSYSAPSPLGGEPTMSSEFLDGRFRSICATFEFLNTWLHPDSIQLAAFKRMISSSSIMSVEEINGVSVFHLQKIQRNEHDSEHWRGVHYRVDDFLVEAEHPHRMVGWSITNAFQPADQEPFSGNYSSMLYRYKD